LFASWTGGGLIRQAGGVLRVEVVVLGSGVVGVTLAWELLQRGHRVSVVDRAASAGLATSFANGGQLSYSYTDSLADPSLLAKIPGMIMGRDPAFELHLSADPRLISWSLRFLRNCTAERARRNTRNVLRLALYSRERLHALLQHEPLDFDFRQEGKLHLYADAAALEKARGRVFAKSGWGCPQEVLTADECRAREPALSGWRGPIAGGVFSPLDESGDAYRFTETLAAACQRAGADMHFATQVTGFEARRGSVQAVLTDQGRICGDRYVLALGAQSALLDRDLGMSLPVYPLKGYSVTVPVGPTAPKLSITDTNRKVVFCVLGQRLRIAGMAELAGYDEATSPQKIRGLLDAGRNAFPQGGDYTQVEHQWAGFRPVTPDSAPLLGASDYSNLLLNTGHGMLGWTLACGSAALVADLVDGAEPGIDMDGLTLERFR
jgi:D-amino-acid dehydrogenase